MAEHHELMGGKLHVYKRENSTIWQCSTYLAGKNWRVSTKEESLSHAKEIAEDWYLGLRGKSRNGELKTGKLFKAAAEEFMAEYRALTQASSTHVKLQEGRIRVHLLPFFGNKVCPEITPDLAQQYRIHRNTPPKEIKAKTEEERAEWKPPARSTLHQEFVALRQILKTAARKGWIPYLPDLSNPFRGPAKISHRAWFSPEEYKQLYTATRERAAHPKNPRWRKACEQLHDYVLFMANTGLRPDEAARLEFRDVVIVADESTGERILEIEVRGKRGVGHCKSMPGAVKTFERLQSRNSYQPTDPIFKGKHQRELFNAILDELVLKFDREGNRRTFYSLRHTYICLRLMEGADIYQIAKNCRTSVEMIEKYYASHIKNMLDASAINIRKSKRYELEEQADPKPTKPRAAKGSRRPGRPVKTIG